MRSHLVHASDKMSKQVCAIFILLIANSVDLYIFVMPNLALHILKYAPDCSVEFKIFDDFKSCKTAVEFLKSETDLIAPSIEVLIEVTSISGCYLQDGMHSIDIFDAVHYMIMQAAEANTYSVLLGPNVAADCSLINDLIILSPPTLANGKNLFHINYGCRSVNNGKDFTSNSIKRTDSICTNEFERTASVPIPLLTKTINVILNIFLRFKTWTRIAFLIESSLHDFTSDYLAAQIRHGLESNDDYGLVSFEIVEMLQLWKFQAQWAALNVTPQGMGLSTHFSFTVLYNYRFFMITG